PAARLLDRSHDFVPPEPMTVGSELVCASAPRMTSATIWGCEIMITCDPSTSVMVAPARSAIERTTSVPAALSAVATTAQLGNVFQAGRPLGSENASSATGRCVAPTIAASTPGQDWTGNLVDDARDVGGVDGHATERIRWSCYLDSACLQSLDHTGPA